VGWAGGGRKGKHETHGRTRLGEGMGKKFREGGWCCGKAKSRAKAGCSFQGREKIVGTRRGKARGRTKQRYARLSLDMYVEADGEIMGRRDGQVERKETLGRL